MLFLTFSRQILFVPIFINLTNQLQIEGGELLELSQWWTDFQNLNPEQRQGMLKTLREKEGGPPKRRSRYRGKKKAAQ